MDTESYLSFFSHWWDKWAKAGNSWTSCQILSGTIWYIYGNSDRYSMPPSELWLGRPQLRAASSTMQMTHISPWGRHIRRCELQVYNMHATTQLGGNYSSRWDPLNNQSFHFRELPQWMEAGGKRLLDVLVPSGIFLSANTCRFI